MVRTRDIRPRGRVGRPVTPAGTPSLPPPDRDLSYYEEGMRWNFSRGKILLDGLDVNELVSGSDVEVSSWLGIAGGLDNYRKKILASARPQDQFTRFEAVIEALLGKIFGRVKRVYDQKTTGLRWSLEEGQLILNGINVRSLLALYRVRKTEKARKFLEGLRDKLALLLQNPAGEKIREMVQDLHAELVEELREPAARGGRALPPGRPLDH